MTQIFSDNNNVVPVTLIKAGPCFVVQVRNQEKDGYEAVQVGFEEINDRKTKKPQKGHFKKHGLEKNYRYLREFSDNKFKSGDKIDVSLFNNGEIVNISGISKGKGFQGVVKRHGFKGSPASHGTKHTLRAPGSIGSAFPQRVFKGKRMAGRMGSDRITVSGLEIINISKEDNLLAIKGAVPGKPGTLLEIIVTKEIEAVKEEKQEKLIDDLEKKESEAKGKKAEPKDKKEKKEEVKDEKKDNKENEK